MAVEIKIRLNTSKAKERIFSQKTGMFLAKNAAQRMEKYVPMDSGALSQNYELQPYCVVYTMPYARYIWNGVSKNGKGLNFKKQMHPNATAKWEQTMARAELPQIAKDLTNYLSGVHK